MSSRISRLASSLTFHAQKMHYGFSTSTATPIQTLMQIIDKKVINHDSYIYRMKFIEQVIPISIGQHLAISQVIKTYHCAEGEEVTRRYTPITPCGQHEVIELLIKVYRPNTVLKYPTGGKLTPFLQTLNVGDKVHVEGPLGRFNYAAGGKVTIDDQTTQVQRMVFLAGGTGITPCYQVISEINNMKEEKVELILLVANKTEEDILLRPELEALKGRVKIYYTLDLPPEGWTGFTGYVSLDMLQKISPLEDPNTLYLYSGPAGMNKLIRELFNAKFPQAKLFKF